MQFTVKLEIINVKFVNGFTNIDSYLDGGAAIFSRYGNLSVVNCCFINNSCCWFGGAIYLDKGNLDVVNCCFINNSCPYGGGAIYSYEGNVSVVDCCFVNNSGGAIRSYEGNVSVMDCCFVNNSRGGDYSSAIGLWDGYLSVINCSFANNYGSAIYLSNGYLDVVDCSFVNNSAYDFGSAIYFVNGYLDVVDCCFVNNSGGAIYSYEGNVSVVDCCFINNSCSLYGAAICFGYSYLDVVSCCFVNNSAYYDSIISSSGYGKCEVFDSMFINNTSDQIIRLYSGNLTIFDSSFIGVAVIVLDYGNLNIVNNSGLSSISGGGNMSVVNCSFNNSGLSAISGGGNMSVVGCSFVDCVGDNYGGAICFGNGYLSVVNCSFVNNLALTCKGGAIYICMGNVSVVGCSFVNNSAPNYDGGAIYSDKCDLHIVNCSFVNNSAISGGASYSYKGNLSVVNCSFVNNFDVQGASIKSSNSNLTIENSFFSNNITNYGAQLIADNGDLNLSNNIFKGNIIPICVSSATSINSPTFVLGNVTDNLNDISFFIRFTDDNNNTIGSFEYLKIMFGNYLFYMWFDNEIGGYSGNYYAFDGFSPIFTLDKFTNLTSNITFNLIGVFINADPVVMYYGDDSKFVVYVYDHDDKPLKDYNLTISLNGVLYNRTTDENGIATLDIIGLSPDKYDISVVSSDAREVNTTITVLSTVFVQNLTKIYMNDSHLFARLLDGEGRSVEDIEASIMINGVSYNRITDSNGFIKLNINLRPGSYIAIIHNNCTGQNMSILVTVLSKVVSNNLTKYYKNDSHYKATILDNNGNSVGAGVKVVFNIHGIFYEKETDENGIVKLNINLAPGVYIITIMHDGLNQTNIVTVLSTINSNNIEMTNSMRKPFNIIVLNNEGLPANNTNVSFNINGVFYNKTTDNNGFASLDINLMEGFYIITSILDNGLMQSNTITVKE